MVIQAARSKYRAWYDALSPAAKKMLGYVYNVAGIAAIVVVVAALYVTGHQSAREQLHEPLWISISLWIVGLLALIAGTLYAYALFVVALTYIGDTDTRVGFRRFALSALLFLAASWVVHRVAFYAWMLTPLADRHNELASQYEDLCTVDASDEDGPARDDDWHAGSYLCAPLLRQLRATYPSPEWLFGAPPR